jgi:hypothetical protein
MKVKLYSILTIAVLLSACGGRRVAKTAVNSYEEARANITAVNQTFEVVKDAEWDAVGVASKAPTLAAGPPALIAALHSGKWAGRALKAAKINEALLEAESAKALGEPWRGRAETLKQLDELLEGFRQDLDTQPFLETATVRRMLMLARPLVVEVRKFVEELPE